MVSNHDRFYSFIDLWFFGGIYLATNGIFSRLLLSNLKHLHIPHLTIIPYWYCPFVSLLSFTNWNISGGRGYILLMYLAHNMAQYILVKWMNQSLSEHLQNHWYLMYQDCHLIAPKVCLSNSHTLINWLFKWLHLTITG